MAAGKAAIGKWWRNKITNKTTVELLNNHFDIALETPDGVKKLRELILTLAMQYRLVKQDLKDQPARTASPKLHRQEYRNSQCGLIKNTGYFID